MPAVLRFRVEKLIRDRIGSQLRARGIELYEHQLDAREYEACLRAKLLEEAAEVVQSTTPAELEEELADLVEVILALCQVHGLSHEQLDATRRAKHAAKGGFMERIYNTAVEMAPDNPAASYYLERPRAYPLLAPVPRDLYFDRRSDHLRYTHGASCSRTWTALRAAVAIAKKPRADLI